jgi:DNA-binding transcriptional regulator YiaG
MTKKQFTAALNSLGIPQQQFAEAIRVNERTVRNWVSGRSEVPTVIAVLINLMIERKLTLEDLRV